jgi:poly(3-hydroxybutyrate) depolymerase
VSSGRALRAVAGLAVIGASAVFFFGWGLRDTRTVLIAGSERSFDVVVQGDVDAGSMPLVLVFHGRDGTSWNIRRRFALDRAAHDAGDRAVFAYLQGVALPGLRAVAWQTDCDGPDVKFADEVVRTLSAQYPIDPQRLFVAGMSWGGEMTMAYACCHHDTVRAMAPMSGGVWDNLSDVCRAPVPAVRVTMGEDDTVVSPVAVHHLVEEFRARQGCSPRTHPTEDHCVAWEGCAAPVIACWYPTLGHRLAPRAGPETWNFFRSFK